MKLLKIAVIVAMFAVTLFAAAPAQADGKLASVAPTLTQDAKRDPAPFSVLDKAFYVDAFAKPVAVYEVVTTPVKVFRFEKLPPLTLSAMAGAQGTQAGVLGVSLTMSGYLGQDLQLYGGPAAWLVQDPTDGHWTVAGAALLVGIKF